MICELYSIDAKKNSTQKFHPITLAHGQIRTLRGFPMISGLDKFIGPRVVSLRTPSTPRPWTLWRWTDCAMSRHTIHTWAAHGGPGKIDQTGNKPGEFLRWITTTTRNNVQVQVGSFWKVYSIPSTTCLYCSQRLCTKKVGFKQNMLSPFLDDA